MPFRFLPSHHRILSAKIKLFPTHLNNGLSIQILFIRKLLTLRSGKKKFPNDSYGNNATFTRTIIYIDYEIFPTKKLRTIIQHQNARQPHEYLALVFTI